MMYRNFAIATLIGAPILVLAVQNFVPSAPAPAEQAPPAVVAAPAAPAVVVPSAPPAAPAVFSEAPAFGQPMSDAGAPSLSPGQGLPESSSRAGTGSYVPGTAPEGSPNAEP